MANRQWDSVKTLGRNKVVIQGSFAPDTANPPTSVKGSGIASVVRSAAGRFLVTFQDSYPDLESVVVTTQLAAAADMTAQAGTYDATAKTLIIRTLVGAVETDIAANANNRVNFVCTFRNSTRV